MHPSVWLESVLIYFSIFRICFLAIINKWIQFWMVIVNNLIDFNLNLQNPDLLSKTYGTMPFGQVLSPLSTPKLWCPFNTPFVRTFFFIINYKNMFVFIVSIPLESLYLLQVFRMNCRLLALLHGCLFYIRLIPKIRHDYHSNSNNTHRSIYIHYTNLADKVCLLFLNNFIL